MANYKKNKSRLLALLLAVMTMTSFAATMTACDDPESNSGNNGTAESVEPEKDTSRIKNGSFEYFTKSDTTLIATSVNNWTNAPHSSQSGSALSSKTASGIVNTDADVWEDLTTPSGEAFDTEDEAAENWDKLSTNDKLKFIQAWKDDDDNEKRKLTDLSFYDSAKDNFNIDYDDVPSCDNPGTHYATADEENTHVLMIHNSRDNYGTAQKYTASSEIVLSAGTAAELSMWVKTDDLTYVNNATGETQPVVDLQGAYISISQQVGSQTLNDVVVKGINTQAINPDDDNNGWVQYTFYLNACSYAESTFKIALGLGMSGGSNRLEYVSGYAFFDDVTCKTMRSTEFDTKVSAAVTAGDILSVNDVVDVNSDEDARTFRTDRAYKDVTTYAIDLDKSNGAFTSYDFANDAAFEYKYTEYDSGENGVFVSAFDKNGNVPAGKNIYPYISGFQTASDDVGLYDDRADLVANANPSLYLDAFLANAFKDDSFFKDDETLLMLSADGAAYTASLKNKTGSEIFVVPANKRIVLSFFLKTSNMKGKTGASVTVYNANDPANSVSLTTLDTSAVKQVDVDSEQGQDAETNIYQDWQQCFFFLENSTTTDQYFAIDLNVGPVNIKDTSDANYYPGYAAFTRFQSREINKDEYAFASKGTYTALLSLAEDEDVDHSSFDASTSIGKDIETTLADLSSYRGVYGNSAFVNDTSKDKLVNDYKYAGLFSKEYLQNYVDQAATAGADYWLNKLNSSADKAWLETLIGDAYQPAIILNDGVKSYGFIGQDKTISSGNYQAISVRVKASAGASVYVYLTDTSDKTHSSSLSVGRGLTYWYDADGNVCVADPTDDDFNKKTDVAFYLQPNGLYKANEKWSGATDASVDKNAYYANLKNYEIDEETNNLLVAKGGVSYNYTSKWKNDGNDGVAFYYKDGAYYADSKHTVKVLALEDVSVLPARYTAVEGKSLVLSYTNETATTSDWQTLTFYIKPGTTAKTYRLEVWSGTREGTPNAPGSFVLFDDNNYGTLDETTYTGLLTYAKDKLIAGYQDEDEFKANYSGVLYSAFSFYDSAKFLRYDETMDEKGVGNSYDDFDATDSTYSKEGIAYLRYTEGAEDVVFVDFSINDKTVPVDVDKTVDTEIDETPADNAGTNVLLLVSSIAIAVVLLLVLVSLAVQKIVKSYKKKHRSTKKVERKADADNGSKRRFSMRKTVEQKPDDKKDEE